MRDDKVDVRVTCLLFLLYIFALQFLKLAQISLKFERNELYCSSYDKNQSEGSTVVTPHAVAVLRAE